MIIKKKVTNVLYRIQKDGTRVVHFNRLRKLEYWQGKPGHSTAPKAPHQPEGQPAAEEELRHSLGEDPSNEVQDEDNLPHLLIIEKQFPVVENDLEQPDRGAAIQEEAKAPTSVHQNNPTAEEGLAGTWEAQQTHAGRTTSRPTRYAQEN